MLKPSPFSPLTRTSSSTNEDHIAPQLSTSSDLEILFGAGPSSGSVPTADAGNFDASETALAAAEKSS